MGQVLRLPRVSRYPEKKSCSGAAVDAGPKVACAGRDFPGVRGRNYDNSQGTQEPATQCLGCKPTL